MDTYRLPMFPLGTPLVPGALLPLQIFEPRYQLMMSDVLHASEPEFGVVLLLPSRERVACEAGRMRGRSERRAPIPFSQPTFSFDRRSVS